MPKKPCQNTALIVGINMRDMHPYRVFHRRLTIEGLLVKTAQNCMKKAKSAFLGQNSLGVGGGGLGKHGGLAKILASVG